MWKDLVGPTKCLVKYERTGIPAISNFSFSRSHSTGHSMSLTRFPPCGIIHSSVNDADSLVNISH